MSTPKFKATKSSSDQDGESAAIIKKVKAYPIESDLFKEGVAAPRRANIVKLTTFGFLIKIEGSVGLFKVNENYSVSFSLPVSNYAIKSTVKVVKTYDAVDNPLTKSKIYTVELHFINLESEGRAQIKDFLKKIGQRE